MHETGAQWLMTSLEPSPEMVSAVRTAMALPVFCLALPAGVWADRFDRRRWLLSTQALLVVLAAGMAILTLAGSVTPLLLLVLTAGMGIAMVLNQPAWQALTPELVPPALVPSAVAVGSISFNLARSLGPAVAGLIIAQFGVWAAFSLNAVSFLGVIVALLYWKPVPDEISQRSSPEFLTELRKGIYVVGSSAHLRNTLLRVFVFALSASILWSLLALVATDKLGFQERGFGACLSLIGAGAVACAWVLPLARAHFTSERILLIAQTLFAVVCCLIGWLSTAKVLMPALLVVGGCWMATMTTLNATAQINLPRRFRARGMAAYLMSLAAGMSLGSAAWGWLAYAIGLSGAFLVAGAVLASTALLMHSLPIGSLHVDETAS